MIRQTKFGKDRLVPFGPRMAGAITAFLAREETRCGPMLVDAPVFSFGTQKRTSISTNAIRRAPGSRGSGGMAAGSYPPPLSD